MDLYYHEANGSGTITLDKLSTDLADDCQFIYGGAPVGLVSAVDYNDSIQATTILERTDRNAPTSGGRWHRYRLVYKFIMALK